MSLLTINNLVTILRSSVNVQDPDMDGSVDPAYLALTDSDIELFIKLGVTRAYPSVTSLSELPEGSEYPIILLAKIELYSSLAVRRAEKVDLGAESAYLKLSQRFEHYMELAKEARQQYRDWTETDGCIVTTYDMKLGKFKKHLQNFSEN